MKSFDEIVQEAQGSIDRLYEILLLEKAPNLESSYLADKWYPKGSFDKEAAKVLGFTQPESLPTSEFPLPRVDTKVVKPIEVTDRFVIQNKRWNYPALIEAYELENPGTRMTRAAVKQLLKKAPTIALLVSKEVPVQLKHFTILREDVEAILKQGFGDGKVLDTKKMKIRDALLFDLYLDEKATVEDGSTFYFFKGMPNACKITTRNFNIQYEVTKDPVILKTLQQGLSKERHYLKDGSRKDNLIILDVFETFNKIIDVDNILGRAY